MEATISGRVLEIGAVPAPETLLTLPSVAGTSIRVGINIDGPHRLPRAVILKGNANEMSMFRTGAFDAVLCNSVLEHDPHFWLTLAEMFRVARPGALVAIGVPGYAEPPPSKLRAVAGLLAKIGLLDLRRHRQIGSWLSGTPTLGIHNYSGDYFRFSAQAMRRVLLAGYRDVRVEIIMQPPRVIGWGRHP